MSESVKKYLSQTGFKSLDLKAVFFDMDGILFNSMPQHAAAWTRVMHEHGITSFKEEDAFLHEGRTGSAIVDIFFDNATSMTEEEKQNVYKKKTEYFLASGPVQPVANVKDVLEYIQPQGLDIYVVTGSGTKTMFERLNTYFPGIFDTQKMVTAFDVKHGKPNPEPYLKGLEKAGIEPWQGIVVENAPLGVRAAVAANIFTVAINTGPIPASTLQDEGANLLYPDMATFLEDWKHGELPTLK
ncbi:MAG: HAD hydrolase-like protein [Bacteroidales bacterium]|nr:HAD hydrolase-like protein [Bacteroidales bacterium]